VARGTRGSRYDAPVPSTRVLARIIGVGLLAGVAAGAATALASIVGLSSIQAVAPVAIVVAAAVASALLLWVRVGVTAAKAIRAQRASDIRVRELQGELRETLAEIGAIATLSAVPVPYPLPLGGNWALSWDAAVLLAREVAIGRPRTVVELGSGGSSIVVGLQLREAGVGHLYSLDHDAAFAALTRRHVVAQGLDDVVSVLDAPLVAQEIAGSTFRWYDVPSEVEALDRIDLMIVDGPPQATDRDGTPRYPALPVLASKLGPGSVVFVDDGNRDAERRMLDRWLIEQPHWQVERIRSRRGTVILRWPLA
jgi:predicted O-methyltransferase YrrM